MAEYLIQDTTLTNIAAPIKTLMGLTDYLTTDEMVSNLNDANTAVANALVALTEKEVVVPNGSNVTDLAALIAAIESGLPVAAYGSVILSEDQTTDYKIETGIILANKSVVVFQKNKTNEKINGSLLYTSNFGLTLTSGKKISAGYRGGGTAAIYATEVAGIKNIINQTELVIGGNATANYSYGFKAGVEYIWLVLEG